MTTPSLKGTKTEENLKIAFAGESQARNKYTYYASKARKDGYVQIAKIFDLLGLYIFKLNCFLTVSFHPVHFLLLQSRLQLFAFLFCVVIHPASFLT